MRFKIMSLVLVFFMFFNCSTYTYAYAYPTESELEAMAIIIAVQLVQGAGVKIPSQSAGIYIASKVMADSATAVAIKEVAKSALADGVVHVGAALWGLIRTSVSKDYKVGDNIFTAPAISSVGGLAITVVEDGVNWRVALGGVMSNRAFAKEQILHHSEAYGTNSFAYYCAESARPWVVAFGPYYYAAGVGSPPIGDGSPFATAPAVSFPYVGSPDLINSSRDFVNTTTKKRDLPVPVPILLPNNQPDLKDIINKTPQDIINLPITVIVPPVIPTFPIPNLQEDDITYFQKKIIEKSPIIKFKATWDKLNNISLGTPVAPKFKINLSSLLGSASRLTQNTDAFANTDTVFLDFAILEKFNFMGKNVVAYFRMIFGYGFVLLTFRYVWKKITNPLGGES